jgi:C4-dicarboxylate-specific signal transduction histidine kinase
LSRDLTTVVGNLVDNAFDAVTGLPDAAVRVLVEEERDPATGADQVTVTVRDTGPGIPDDAVEEIFRQGFTTKEAGPADGRGFGLALSRVVCRRSGGDLTVANSNGAVFTARFTKEANQSKRGRTKP